MTQKAAWRQCGTCHRMFDSMGEGAMPTTVDPTENASLCVKNFTSVKNATKSYRTKNGSPRENCVGIAKSFLTQLNTDVI